MAASTSMGRRAAVLGSPIGHSLSPVLHQAAYEVLGLDWRYEALQVEANELAQVIATLRRDPQWAGLSLTMPLKERALQLADSASEVAVATNAANTLTFSGGQVRADNTDPAGIIWALGRAGVESLVGTHPVLLGAGATARSAIAALGSLGAVDVTVCARRPGAIAELAEIALGLGVRVRAADLAEVGDLLDGGLLVSTLPAGVADDLAPGVRPNPGVLLDVIYAPWPTALAASWSDNGGAVVGGLEMLVGQAGRQIELMTGCVAPLPEMYGAGLKAQARR